MYSSPMDFFSMGMFILDEIHWGQKKYNDVIGGAGTYAAVAAGLFMPKDERNRAGCIVDMGSDFPPDQLDQLKKWKVGFYFRTNDDRLTTRGWNNYGDNEARDFRYMTPKLQVDAKDLLEYPPAANAKCIHFICSPPRLLEFVHELKPQKGQLVLWEPVPTECIPEQWPKCRQCFDKVDILSPNAKEAASFLGRREPQSKEEIEQLAGEYSAFKGMLVIRAGHLGSLVVQNGLKRWYEPYHLDQEKVVDPTGGGNSFLGGLGIGLVRYPKEQATAMAYANVAASFMIEQVGFPEYDPEADRWNGDLVANRVAKYRARAYLGMLN